MARCNAVSWVQLICLSSMLCKGVLSLDHVPMLLWSTHRSFQGLATTLHEGHVISKHELHALLKQALASPDPRNVALFLQDALSVDDFTRYAGSSGNETPFRNVQWYLRSQMESVLEVRSNSKMFGNQGTASDWFQEAPAANRKPWKLHRMFGFQRTFTNWNIHFAAVGSQNVRLTRHLGSKELLKTSSSSLVLPAVDCHAVNHLSGYLQETLNWALVNVDGKDTPQLMVNGSKPNVFVIKLPLTSRANDLSTRKELLENDKIMGEFTKSMQQQGIESVAIYTARRPSKVPVGPDVAWQSRRHLMSVENQGANLYAPINITSGTGPNATCILFYATDLNFTAGGTVMNLTHRTFESHEVDTSNSVCSETNATLSLKYTNPVKGIENLTISFVMTNKDYVGSARKWFTLDFVHIEQDNKEMAIFTAPSISGPAEYSFHCQQVGTSDHYGATLTPYNDAAKEWQVVISEFQIQAFNVEGHKFSYASDCTTFFTPGIWMGLVTSLVLLLILTFGVHMIVNLTTNNRFDDPKDQPLSVPQGE